jgi:hypothetical protein
MESRIPRTPCESAKIASHGYDAETQTLALTFKAKDGESLVYHYDPYTPADYEKFCGAESKGKFFNANIVRNPAIKCTKMIPEEKAAA